MPSLSVPHIHDLFWKAPVLMRVFVVVLGLFVSPMLCKEPGNSVRGFQRTHKSLATVQKEYLKLDIQRPSEIVLLVFPVL